MKSLLYPRLTHRVTYTYVDFMTKEYIKRLLELSKQLQEIQEKTLQNVDFVRMRNSKLDHLIGYISVLEYEVNSE